MQSAVGIDPGEAAAVAQFQKLSARFIISEDGKFHENAPKLYPGITIIKLKHVFAMLDINNLIDWALCISLLHKKRKMTSSELRIAYLSVAKWYGLEISGKKLSEKTSLKKLGLI